MENVGIVVDDCDAATAFFVELGLELLGEGPVEGDWVDTVVGPDDVRVEVVMLQAPNGGTKLELSKFHKTRRRTKTRKLRQPTSWDCAT